MLAVKSHPSSRHLMFSLNFKIQRLNPPCCACTDVCRCTAGLAARASTVLGMTKGQAKPRYPECVRALAVKCGNNAMANCITRDGKPNQHWGAAAAVMFVQEVARGAVPPGTPTPPNPAKFIRLVSPSIGATVSVTHSAAAGPSRCLTLSLMRLPRWWWRRCPGRRERWGTTRFLPVFVPPTACQPNTSGTD